MNKSSTFSKLLLLCVASFGLSSTLSAYADGSGTSGGGDVTTARKVELSKSFVSLKEDLKALLGSLDIGALSDEGVKVILMDIISRGLTEDIEKSTYQLSEKCADEAKIGHAASTVIGVRNADICFDLDKLSAQNAFHGELLGLATHEHAHHFGYEDNADLYRLITVVANSYAETKLRKTLESFATLDSPNLLNEKIRAHKTVFTTLHEIGQIGSKINFENAGLVLISSFPAVRLGGEGQVTKALSLATQLDSIFANGRKAKRNKPGINYRVLIAAILKDGEREGKNVRWFADQIASLYTFGVYDF